MTLLAIKWFLLQRTPQRNCTGEVCSKDCQWFWMTRTTPENCPPLGDLQSHLIMLPWAHLSLRSKRHLDRFSRFYMGPKCCAYNALSMWKKTPQNYPFPLDFVTPPEEDRATAIGNMHKKLVKIARVVREISSRTDKQTDRQTYSSQYFAGAPAGEVNITVMIYFRIEAHNADNATHELWEYDLATNSVVWSLRNKRLLRCQKVAIVFETNTYYSPPTW